MDMNRILAEERDLARAQMADELRQWLMEHGFNNSLFPNLFRKIDQLASQPGDGQVECGCKGFFEVFGVHRPGCRNNP